MSRGNGSSHGSRKHFGGTTGRYLVLLAEGATEAAIKDLENKAGLHDYALTQAGFEAPVDGGGAPAPIISPPRTEDGALLQPYEGFGGAPVPVQSVVE